MGEHWGNDYELLYLIHQGSEEAYNLLLNQYQRMFWSSIHGYHYQDDSDHSEVFQRCLICFHKAVTRYREDGEASFSSYLHRLLDREMIDYVRRYRTIQKQYELQAVSLDQCVQEQDSIYLIDCVENNQPYFDGRWVLQYQELKQNWLNAKQNLCKQDRLIWEMRTDGYTYDQISQAVGISKKKVDNTLQKIRRKNKRLFDYEGSL